MVLAFYPFRNPVKYVKFKLGCIGKHSKLGRIWIEDHSPMLGNLRKKLSVNHSFEGIKIGVCLPGTWESFMFLSALEVGGARLLYYPMFIKPEVGIELLKIGGIKLFDNSNFEKCVRNSDFVYDSTAFFGRVVVQQRVPVKGIVEQTASGIGIYRDFDTKGVLRQPVLNLDASHVKTFGENKLATGLGLVEALLRLHLFLPGKQVLVLGFGSVGYGCALYLKRVGCEVAIFDIDSDRMIEAENQGYQVGTLEELLPYADVIVNATGASSPVLKAKELKQLKSGAILANMGGCGWDQTFFLGKNFLTVGDWVKKIFLDDATYIYELAQGFPVNFVFASGTDTETMDMVFSLSVLALDYLVKNYESLPNHLLPIPDKIQKKHLEQVVKFSARKNFGKERELNK